MTPIIVLKFQFMELCAHSLSIEVDIYGCRTHTQRMQQLLAITDNGHRRAIYHN